VATGNVTGNGRPGAVYRCRNDADWTVEFISEGCFELTGYRADELTGSRVTSLGAILHPDDAAAAWEKCQASLAAHRSCSNEYRITHRNGDTRWVWHQAQGVYTDGGELLHIEGLITDITGRKVAELALRESEGRFRALIEHAQDGIAVFSAGGVILYASPSVTSVMGYLPGELQGRPAGEFVRPDSQESFRASLAECLRRPGVGIHAEAHVRHRDGSWRFLEGTLTNMLHDPGVAGIVNNFRDITARKQAEENLRASEERLRLATQAAGIGAFEWDVPAGVNVWTPKLEALHGLRPGEFRGTQAAWEQLVHPADRARALALVQHAFDKLSPQAGEWRVVWPDGSVHWLAGRFQAFHDEAGAPRRLIGVNYDITASKQAEAALRVAESKYHAIFQHAIEGIYQSTVEGRYLTLNPAMARIYGYASAAEMLEEVTDIGRQLYLDPTDRRQMQALLHAQGGTGVFECQMRRKDGSLIWVRQSARVVRDGRGRVLGYEGSVEDITERRLAEERLRHQHALLSAVVEGASDAVFLKDLAGRYQLINAAGARAMGRPVEEILGRTDAELLPPETASRFRVVDEAVVATGTTQVQEESGFMVGNLSHWHANKAPWRDADGRIQGVIGVSRDISESRRAKELLALRARQQAVVADLGLLALAATELPPLFDQAAARVAETFGVEFCKVLELLPDGSAVKLVAGVGWQAGLVGHATLGVDQDSQAGHTLRTKEPVIVEDLRTEARFNGPPLLREHGVVSGLSVIIGQAEHPVGVLGVHSTRRRGFTPDDVSFLQAVANVLAQAIRRHRVEQARRESEAALNRAQAVAHIGSWRLDVTRNVLTWSAESHRIFGIPEGTPLTYESFLGCVHPADRAMVDCAWKAALAGAHYDIQHRVVVGEETRWVRERAVLEFDAAGRLLGGVGTTQDITERARTEAEVVHLSGRLLRAQDEERRRLARELHDSTAQTFAALAMNLAVLGRTAPGMDDASRALLAECETQVRRGTAELRTLAYLLHPPALEALGLTRAIHDYAEGFARRSGIQVELDVAELPVRLPPDTELALFRVLQESLGNLHRHSGSATAAIRLAQDAETVVIEVRDTGCGLGLTGLAAATSGSACFGVGIAGMRERLRLLGGRLEIEAALPGVRVRATLPLSTTADE
jgi:PAS domain S-box-containing protein